jgi:hypothetical protein
MLKQLDDDPYIGAAPGFVIEHPELQENSAKRIERGAS